uniref:Putative metalloprotease n=1 Tax=Ixodes ricinus TaxID=34613 RepID=A0A0K8RK71_IXORI
MSGLGLKYSTVAFFSFCLSGNSMGSSAPGCLKGAGTGEWMLKINDDLTLTLQKNKVLADDFLSSTTNENETIDY